MQDNWEIDDSEGWEFDGMDYEAEWYKEEYEEDQ